MKLFAETDKKIDHTPGPKDTVNVDKRRSVAIGVARTAKVEKVTKVADETDK